jgi:PAS domain S-box-containing protein
MGSLFYLAIVGAMSYQLGSQLVTSAQVSYLLQMSEARVLETEQRLDDAAGAADLGCWEWNVQRDEIWATDRFRALFGLAREQRLDLATVFEVVHPNDRPALQDAVKVSLEDRVALEQTYRVLLPDGTSRWIFSRGRVTSAAGSRESIVHGVSIDISARKQLEERFRRVVDVAPVGLMILRQAGTIDLVNPWIETTFGYPSGKLTGLSIDAILPQFASQADDQGYFADALATGRVAALKSTGRRSDGSELELEIRADSIPATNGSGLQILVTMIDISDRERSQRSLAQERAFLRHVIDIDPNLIFAKDRQGRFTLANQATADIYGTTVQDLIGKTDADFNSKPEEVEHFRRIDAEVMESLHERRIAEEEITDFSGRVHVLQTVKRPIVGPDNVVHQLLGTATDITARKLAEQTIRVSEEFNRSILSSLQDHVVILDRNGVVLAVNDAWQDFRMPAGTPTPMGEGAVGCNYLDSCAYVRSDGDTTGTSPSARRPSWSSCSSATSSPTSRA